MLIEKPMTSDNTQYQSNDGQRRAEQLSLQPTRPPAQIAGYEILRFLGSGAYGEVWVATDTRTGRQVAIKFYLHRGGLDWSLLSREVEKLVFLAADRYVVQLLDVGWEAEPPYYVMEFVENGSLDEYLQRTGPLPVAASVELLREVAVGLSHAHQKGVLHCDLKPANVLLDQDHRPRLADFGQSRLSTEQMPALGTLFYMAPEQANLDAMPDARWDVYALGVLFYCMVTGSPPYRNADTAGEIDTAASLAGRLARYREIVYTTPLPTEHRRIPGMDGHLAEIIERCLAKQPDTRFHNAQELLDALHQRERARARRPLLLFGILGPVLLTIVMTLLAIRWYKQAIDNSTQALLRRAHDINRVTAEFAASSIASEIGRYFQAIEYEARREEFQALSRKFLQQDFWLPYAEEAATTAAVEQLAANPLRKDLEEYLRQRLSGYRERAEEQPDGLQFASIFVLAPNGIMLAGDFGPEVISNPIGRNYAWRTYYHAGPNDYPETWPPERLARIEPLQDTHLSAVYRSTTTGKWKVAISTPVRDGVGPDAKLLGILALTVNLGDFGYFRSSQRRDHFAVLVDGREGASRGVILQHPLFDSVATSPANYSGDACRIPPAVLSSLKGEGRLWYQDPLGQAPGGEAYAGDWIAAAVDVRLPRGTGEVDQPRGSQSANLVVLVQEDSSAATDPVRRLARQLVLEGLLSLLAVAAVVAALWLVLYRWLRDAPSRLRRLPPASSPTPFFNQTTIDTPTRS